MTRTLAPQEADAAVKNDASTDPAVPRTRDPIFIVGVGRSGTSLIQSMLAAHSQVAFPPEINFIRRFLATDRIREVYRAGGCKAVCDRFRTDRYLSRLDLDLAEVLEKVEQNHGSLDGRSVYAGLMNTFACRQGKPRFGDKDPKSVEYLPVLDHHFPRAFVVHVIRDPRDVLASKKKAGWSSDRCPLVHVAANAIQFRMGVGDGRKLFGDRYVEIRYENLLDQPEKEVRSLLQALLLPEEDLLASFSQAAEELVADEEMSWKKETLGPLLRDNTGNWKHELTPLEHVVSEKACLEAHRHGAYRLEGATRPLVVRIVGGVIGWAIRLLGRLYPRFRRWTYRSVLRSGGEEGAESS